MAKNIAFIKLLSRERKTNHLTIFLTMVASMLDMKIKKHEGSGVFPVFPSCFMEWVFYKYVFNCKTCFLYTYILCCRSIKKFDQNNT